MSENSYQKSVRLFETLMATSTSARHATPAAVFQAANMPSTSGYRNIGLLESEGLLRRAEAGLYCSGDAAIRAGLSAHGFGGLAPKVAPVLFQLRQVVNCTSFLAIQTGMDLHITTYLKGRITRDIPVRAKYTLEKIPVAEAGTSQKIGLHSQEELITRRTRSLLTFIVSRNGTNVMLGVMLSALRDDADLLRAHLLRAAEQLRSEHNAS